MCSRRERVQVRGSGISSPRRAAHLSRKTRRRCSRAGAEAQTAEAEQTRSTLHPLVFCRECDQDYYVVKFDRDRQLITPLLLNSIDADDSESIPEGYLTLDEPELWSAEQPAEFGVGKKRNEEAFTQLIEYRLYKD